MQNSPLSGTFWVLLLTHTVGPKPSPVKASGRPCVATSYDVLLPFPRIDRSFGSVFATSASLWRKQWVFRTHCFLTEGFALWPYWWNPWHYPPWQRHHQCRYWYSSSNWIPPVQDTQLSHDKSPLRLFWFAFQLYSPTEEPLQFILLLVGLAFCWQLLCMLAIWPSRQSCVAS